MKNSHCSQIAHKLLSGGVIDKDWLHDRWIRCHNKRLEKIQLAILARMPVWKIKVYHDTPFWPIVNIGATGGYPVRLNGKMTRCGRYILLGGYKQYLKRAIKEKNW